MRVGMIDTQAIRQRWNQLIGNYKNGGTDYRPQGDPRRVKVHDFEDEELGKIVPYGVYDLSANAGWVSVGITSDTAEFAVASSASFCGIAQSIVAPHNCIGHCVV